MNRKYNPFVSLVAMVLLALILVLTCTGCTSRAEAAEIEPEPAKRYTYEVQENIFGPAFYTITDTQTGNQYLFVHIGNSQGKAGGLTKLEE